MENLQTMGLPNSPNTVTDSYPSSQRVAILPTMLADKFVEPGGKIKVQGPWLKRLSPSILNLWIGESSCKNLPRCCLICTVNHRKTGTCLLWKRSFYFLSELAVPVPFAFCWLKHSWDVAQCWSVCLHLQEKVARKRQVLDTRVSESHTLPFCFPLLSLPTRSQTEKQPGDW